MRMVSVDVFPQDIFVPEKVKNIILLMTSCSVKSVTFFSPENIICENYTNVSVNYF